MGSFLRQSVDCCVFSNLSLLERCMYISFVCSCASYMGHFDMLNYFSIAENETKARVRFSCMERMLQPCGPPPERMED